MCFINWSTPVSLITAERGAVLLLHDIEKVVIYTRKLHIYVYGSKLNT